MTTTRRASNFIYNPHLLRRDVLLALFVARRPLLKELLDDLRRGGAQHHLLIGGRGAGKTSMLLRLAYGIEEDAALRKAYLPLRFPEEQYNVAQPSDFWFNCIDALIDALETRGDHDAVQKLEAQTMDLEDLAEEERGQKAVDLLTDYAKLKNTHLVLLIDNLDIVLERLNDAQWSLREALSQDNRIVLIGAGTTFAQGASYNSPLYDFFNVHELSGLSEDEARDLVIELARNADRPEVETIIRSDPGRFKALFLLSGGTPRTLVLLHDLLAEGQDAQVEDDLERLLDQLTPYYKAQFDDLARQSQVIVDSVALHWHPITAAECAVETRVSINAASAQLDRLCRQGVLTKVPAPGSRKLAFQIAERFFNIWYLMRASRRLRKRLGWLVEFLRVYYGDEEIRKRAEALLAAPAGRRAVEGGAAKLLAFASAVSDAHIRRRLEFKAIEAIIDRQQPLDELRDLLDLQGEDSHLAPILDRAQALRDLKMRILTAKVRWPKGTTGRHWADDLTGNPCITTQEKIRIGDALLGAAPTHRSLRGKAIRLPSLIDGLDPKFYVAISRGEIPPFPELRTAEDLDCVVAAAQGADIRIALAVSFITANREMPDPVLRRVLEIIPRSGVIPIIFLIARTKQGALDLMKKYARFALERYKADGDHSETFTATWSICVDFLKVGKAQELVSILEETGINEQFLPLYEAARAAANGLPASLAHLAPEVRVPAERMLRSFEDPAPSATTKTSAKKPKNRRTRHRR
jgi:hypothetical protein